MAIDFDNECTCGVCGCTYIPAEGNPDDRCKAHLDVPTTEVEKEYINKSFSISDLAARIQQLEADVADLKKTVEPAGFHKKCEKCGKEFSASAPAVKKCDKCKGNN